MYKLKVCPLCQKVQLIIIGFPKTVHSQKIKNSSSKTNSNTQPRWLAVVQQQSRLEFYRVLYALASAKELEDEDTESPPVQSIGVARGCDQLRCEVIWSSTSGESLTNDKLCQPHVSKLDVTAGCQKQILRFEIPMDDIELVEILDTSDDLMKELTSLRLLHSLVGHVIVKQLSTLSVLHDKVQLFRSLDDLVKLDNIWMPDHF